MALIHISVDLCIFKQLREKKKKNRFPVKPGNATEGPDMQDVMCISRPGNSKTSLKNKYKSENELSSRELARKVYINHSQDLSEMTI